MDVVFSSHGFLAYLRVKLLMAEVICVLASILSIQHLEIVTNHNHHLQLPFFYVNLFIWVFIILKQIC